MRRLKVLVVGSGGREHALGWALAHSASVEAVGSAPGNPGLAQLGEMFPVPVDDVAGLADLSRERKYDLVVIGPEQPLASGAGDQLRALGLNVFGPGASGARLESSKAFAKSFMQRHDIPSARFRVTHTREEAVGTLREWGAPVVVKASGLAAGKGVVVAETLEDAVEAVELCLSTFGDAGSELVLEDKLEGEEVSLFAVLDGNTYRLFPGSQDHKRSLEGDRGPNTGGMGAYTPAPVLSDVLLERVCREILEPTLEGFRREMIPFRGLLYLGLMITREGPKLLEYNVRFGDPETQAVLARWGGDLGEVLFAAAQGDLNRVAIEDAAHPAAACVVAVGGDYPRGGVRGAPITGVSAAEKKGVLVFHAGTAKKGGTLVASGGRVLNVVATGSSLTQALDRAYAGLDEIHFEGMRFRGDIGHRALSVPNASS